MRELKRKSTQVKVKAIEHKATLQLLWRAYQGLILAVVMLFLLSK